MRPLSTDGGMKFAMALPPRTRAALPVLAFLSILLAASACMLGCGGGGASSAALPPPPPPPPASIAVTIAPSSASVVLGNMQAFNATVTNATDTSVTWSVSSGAGGSTSAGTISATGVYTAPADLPASVSAQITATSVADATKSATATVTITSDLAVALTPGAAGVLLGAAQSFRATVSSSGRPDTAVRWSISGAACPSACGTLDASGNFTAPPILPAATTVTVTAQSLADPSKQASSTVTILSDIAVLLNPGAAGVELGAALAFRASINSSGQPNPSVRWSLAGAACPATCGTLDTNGNYTAPQILPTPATVTITAQSVADPSKQTFATVTITSNFSLQLSAPAGVGSGGSTTIVATLTPVASSNPSTTLAWSLSGNGCSGASCGVLVVVTTQALGGGAMATSATYTAPATPPSPNIVTITVTPQADPSKKAQAVVTIQAGVGVSLSPATATLAALHRVTLAAQVFGSANNAVTWTVNGMANGNGTVGQICVVASSPCQPLMSGSNLQVDFQAPGAIPTPNPVTVQAASVADTTRSATAQITVINRVLVTVLPSTVTLPPLAVQAFAATVLGTGNQTVVWQVQGTACSAGAPCGTIDASGTYTAPGAAPSPDAVQIVAISADDSLQSGTANVTIATGANILALHPASVYAGAANGFTLRVDGSNFVGSSPGTGSVLLIGGTARTTTCASVTECTAPVTPADVVSVGSVAVQIRDPDATTSNSVSLIVAAQNSSDEVISLSSVAPAATAKDIVVVEPTTAGVSVPGNDLDLNVAALGLFSTANNSCSLAGNPVPLLRPASGVVTADIWLPSARALFIQNTNLDKTAASGALEVQ